MIPLISSTLLALAIVATAQISLPAKPSPVALDGIAHFPLRTQDLATSLAFYQKIGFIRAFELGDKTTGAPTEEFIRINDTQFLELYPTPSRKT